MNDLVADLAVLLMNFDFRGAIFVCVLIFVLSILSKLRK